MEDEVMSPTPKLPPSTEASGMFSLSEEEKLENEELGMLYANKVRRGVINKLTNNGSVIPDDPEAMNILLKAVKDIDGQALGRKRIKAEEKNASAIKDAKAMIRAIYDDPQYLIRAAQQAQGARAGENPDLQDILTDTFTPVPGQDEISPQQESFEEFTARMKQQ